MAGSISGKTFFDLNGNNVLDPADNDFVFGGAVITLRDSSGAAVGTTTADGNGLYSFNGLSDGTYTVSFASPGNGLASSLSGSAQIATVAGGQAITNVDSGYFLPAQIAGFVFSDENGNNTLDNEPLLDGVTVNLIGSSGQVVATAVSGPLFGIPHGVYFFDTVKPGNYTVQAVIPGVTTQPQATGLLNPTQQLFQFNLGVPPAATGSIAGTVFLDTNGDNVLDVADGDSAVAGVGVTLKSGSGVVVGTTSTDAQGHFSFGSLADGAYTVSFDGPPAGTPGEGFLPSQPGPHNVVVAGGQAVANVDAGFYPPGAIVGLGFIDANGSGDFDPGEGIDGETVELLDSQGHVVATTTTSNSDPVAPGLDGVYSFTGLVTGSYSVRFTPPAGDLLSGPASVAATIAPGQAIQIDSLMHAAAPAAPTGSIAGTVFTDADGNNALNGNETGIAGVALELKDASGTVVGSTFTDAQGHYNFTGLAAGIYTVDATPPSGQARDSVTPLSVSVANVAVTEQNVGFYTPAVIAGLVFNDSNHNGTQDGNETFLNGATVNLLDMSGNVVASTTSVHNGPFDGFYSFNVKPGSYQVQLVLPGEPLPQLLKPTGALTSGGQLFFFNPAAQISSTSITGSIFNDPDHSGHQDGGESGFAGVAVMLVKDAGTSLASVVAAVTTDAQGHYSFAGIAAGTYTVISAAPFGDLPTTSQTVTVGPIATGGVGHADFGFAADPTPNAAPLPAATVINIIVRGQSNINFFTQDGYLAQLKTAIEHSLGFDGVNQRVNLLADDATLHPGTAMLGDWLSPVGGDYHNGWTANDLEKQFLSDVASQSAAFKAAPTLVLWLHNESDSEVPGVTTDEWMSAARFEAGLVRAALGQTADTVPYLFVNAIPFPAFGNPQAPHDAVEQNIKIGMATLAADPVFNAQIVAQLADVTMDHDGYINGAHLNAVDDQQLLYRLSQSIPNVLSASALPGSPLAQAGGHVDSAGPQIITAARVDGHPDQILITVQKDGGAGFAASLSAPAAAGVGWSIRNNASDADSVLEASGTHVEIVDDAHLLVTFDGLVPANGKLFYAWGSDRLAAAPTLPGNGNAVYDINNLPIWADPSGILLTGTPPTTGTGSIAGTVFLDADSNNNFDGSDSGISGVNVVLKTEGGIRVATATTDAQGHYSFTTLGDGTYTVNVITPSGQIAESATPLSVVVAGNAAVNGKNIGIVNPALIAGVVYVDANNNDIQDGNEAGVDGVVVNLLDTSGHTVASVISQPQFGFPHGVYFFGDVTPGTYTVQAAATGATGHTTPPLSSGGVLFNFNLGISAAAAAATGIIDGFAFNDINGNGSFDGGEGLVNGEIVELLNFNRDPIASTVTGPGAPLPSLSAFDGAYAFTGVAPGNYYLRFTAPTGEVLTTPVISSVGNITSGQTITINSGLISSAGTITVSGNAFDDINSNGHRDTNETGHTGVNVLLVKDAGTVSAVAVKTTVTDADGHYSFNALAAGNYSVVFSTPSGLESTSPTTVPVGSLVTGQSANASVGFHIDPTPNAAPPVPTTVINVIVRGQSNAQNFSDPNFGNAIGAMKTQLEQLLGFDGVHQRVNIVADFGKSDGANTINSGTALLGQWLSPINGDYHNGWTANNLELGLLTDIAQHAQTLQSGPTAVVWLHNESDILANPGLTTDMWTSAARYEAGLLRGLLGEDASSVPRPRSPARSSPSTAPRRQHRRHLRADVRHRHAYHRGVRHGCRR